MLWIFFNVDLKTLVIELYEDFDKQLVHDMESALVVNKNLHVTFTHLQSLPEK